MNEKGMTLIEVIIAMAILTVIALGLITFLSSTYIGIIRAGDNTEASFDSQEYIELLLADPSSQVSNVSEGTSCYTVTGFDLDFGLGAGNEVTVDGEVCSNGEFEVFIPDE
jgi:prepilin-type N-terminal cleavage/methylation domain-containing protein